MPDLRAGSPVERGCRSRLPSAGAGTTECTGAVRGRGGRARGHYHAPVERGTIRRFFLKWTATVFGPVFLAFLVLPGATWDPWLVVLTALLCLEAIWFWSQDIRSWRRRRPGRCARCGYDRSG